MKRILITLSLRLLLLFVFVRPAYALEAGNSASMAGSQIAVDMRAQTLKAYLLSHKSPLAEYADEFIIAADLYGLPDWRLVPAISGVESTFGKAIPFNSYNAYGWANGGHAFNNWPESIAIVTKTLKQKYYDRGLTTIESIGRVYAPPSSTWAGKVHFFMKKIDDFALSNPNGLPLAN